MSVENVKLVNNTGVDVRDFDSHILAAVDNGGTLPVELADLFELTILPGFNPDGSDRGILEMA